MVSEGLRAFAGRHVLLLQGPVGPFFARLTADLRSVGAEVHKVNFNAGDWFFYHRGALNYRGTMADWPKQLSRLLRELEIDVVLLFGDCRPIHACVREVAGRQGVELGVFEEGYVRPDFITLERFGVNGFSQLPRTPAAYEASDEEVPQAEPVGPSFWSMAGYAALYFIAAWLGQRLFPHYRHHRPVALAALWPWLRAAWRKPLYRWRERGMHRRLCGELRGSYFLVPLQVHNDAQVEVHAAIGGVEGFIQSTVESFAHHAAKHLSLVFKHHPMDRGHRDYGPLLGHLASRHGLQGRILYIHDQHLPTLIQCACGVVVINSTTGLSALHHSRPTFVRGTALYDMPGLTFQGELDDFWKKAHKSVPDAGFYRRFLQHLIGATQINGSFYKRLPRATTMAGITWPTRPGSVAIELVPVRTAGTKPLPAQARARARARARAEA